jgi:hypothetical protein
LVVVIFVVIWGVFALVMDFSEVMLTSPPELAHCASPPQLLLKFKSALSATLVWQDEVWQGGRKQAKTSMGVWHEVQLEKQDISVCLSSRCQYWEVQEDKGSTVAHSPGQCPRGYNGMYHHCHLYHSLSISLSSRNTLLLYLHFLAFYCSALHGWLEGIP